MQVENNNKKYTTEHTFPNDIGFTMNIKTCIVGESNRCKCSRCVGFSLLNVISTVLGGFGESKVRVTNLLIDQHCEGGTLRHM